MGRILKKKKPSLRRQLENWGKAVRERDGNQCAICGEKSHVNAHHIFPKKFWKDYRFELKNGLCLCPKHHAFGKWSVHRGIGDLILFDFLKEYRPDQWEWIQATLKKEEEKYWDEYWQKQRENKNEGVC